MRTDRVECIQRLSSKIENHQSGIIGASQGLNDSVAKLPIIFADTIKTSKMTKPNKYFSLGIALSLTLTFLSSSLFGQNSFKFIEPNISFSYDSTQLKISKRYSNTYYETEAYDFISAIDTLNEVKINVIANHPVENPASSDELEKMMNDRLKQLQERMDPRISFVEYDNNVRRVGDFLCGGIIVLDKKTNSTESAIFCNHISDADNTEVVLTSKSRQSLAPDYEILKRLTQGFSSYSKEKIFREDSLIKSKYTVIVSPTKETIENLKGRRNSYFAIVKTNEQLQHKVKEVRLDIGHGMEIFPSNENGEVYIACEDEEKGSIERKGELIIFNSFGRVVKIPFAFKYDNK